jgi:hypothetical protein
MNLQNVIKDAAFSDYRSHIPGIICEIIECYQYVGFSATLKVIPVGYGDDIPASSDKLKMYNVICCGSVGIYGFPTLMKDLFYAYVITDNPSLIEGRPALIIPKSVLYRNPGSNYNAEPDIVPKSTLKTLVMKKEILIKSRKLS